MAENLLIPSERIISKIYIIRNRKVMLDKDLAELYGVKTKTLNQAVKRNMKRFPEDFMFKLDKSEFQSLRSQIVTSKKGGTTWRSFAFTEQGLAMLSSVLNSDRAINVNIQIIRTFTQIRELLATNKALHHKIMDMEKKYDLSIQEIFNKLGLLMVDKGKSKRKIGF